MGELGRHQDRGFEKVFRYTDGQTDDRLLTQSVMQSALSLGAELACPATVTRINIQDSDCEIEFDHLGESQSIKARAIVNAAGPWANRIWKW